MRQWPFFKTNTCWSTCAYCASSFLSLKWILENKHIPGNGRLIYGCWTKNRGKTHQNGWWKSWKTTLWTNGMIWGGFTTPIFEINTHISNFLGPQKQSTKNSLIFGFYSHGSQHVEVTGIRITTQGTFNRSFLQNIGGDDDIRQNSQVCRIHKLFTKSFWEKKTLKCSHYWRFICHFNFRNLP